MKYEDILRSSGRSSMNMYFRWCFGGDGAMSAPVGGVWHRLIAFGLVVFSVGLVAFAPFFFALSSQPSALPLYEAASTTRTQGL